MKESKYASITFGLGGFHAEALDEPGSICTGGTLHGYSSPEQFDRELSGEVDHRHRPPGSWDGCAVIDIREVVDRHPALAIISPMCNPNLPPGTVDRFGDRVDLSDILTQALVRETTKGQPALALAVASHKFGSLDMVAPDLYLNFWKGHGARTGRIEGNKIVWDFELTPGGPEHGL